MTFGALLAVGGYHRAKAESGEPLDRRAEGWGLLLGIRLTALVLFAVLGRWEWNPSSIAFASVPVPEGWAWAGTAVMAVSAAWLMWMFRTLGANLTDTVVTRRQATFVRSGPYEFVRNPMYTGLLCLMVGTGVAIGNWLPVVLGSAVFTLLAMRTRREERYLVARFGSEYERYMTEVGRFWPKLRR